MLETVIGGVIGIVSRSIPEVLKWLDRKADREHEIKMQDRAVEFEKVRGAQRMAEVTAGADAEFATHALDTLKASIQEQGRSTGIKGIDALSGSVRPVITYAFFVLYALTKIAVVYGAFKLGADWTTALQWAWTSADMALWSGIVNFWFLGRVFDRIK